MIDTQAIRNRILQLALQGQLVKQNSADTPASELVLELSEEINGTASCSPIGDDEIPYSIPQTWVWCRLSDIGTTNIGLTYHPEDTSTSGTIVARSSNIVNGKMDYSDLVRVTCPIRDNQYLGTNDILICARNGSKALVGKCAIFEGEPNTVAFGAFMAVFRTSLYRYVYYYFNTTVFKRNFAGDDSKQINQVTQKILKESLIPIPPLEEQQRIVDKIDQAFSVLDTIDSLQALYADNLTVLKAKLIDAAIQGKLTEQLQEDGTAEELYQRIQDEKQALMKAGKIKKEKPLPEITADEIPFEIPENWKWIRWGDVVNIVSARRVHKADWRESGVPFYRAREIAKLAEEGFVQNDLFISEELFSEFSKTGVPQENDLMVTAVGTLGKTYVVNANDRFYYKDASVLCFENFGGINPYYLVFVMKSDMMRKQIESNSGGTTVDTLTMVRMIRYLLPLPPLAEQKRIAQKIDELMPLFEK